MINTEITQCDVFVSRLEPGLALSLIYIYIYTYIHIYTHTRTITQEITQEITHSYVRICMSIPE